RAEGQWSIPLELTIPLHAGDTDAVQVEGRIHMQQALLQFTPDWSPFSRLDGELHFTQDTVIVPELSGQFLGGAARLSGGVGAGQPGLQMAGRIAAGTLAELAGVPGAE